jgi:hypothetical protein
MNPKIFALNLTFSALFLLSNLMFFYGVKSQIGNGLLIMELIYQGSRLCCELIIMLFASLFGRTITCKSSIKQNGDCEIQGINEAGNQCFIFTIKN